MKTNISFKHAIREKGEKLTSPNLDGFYMYEPYWVWFKQSNKGVYLNIGSAFGDETCLGNGSGDGNPMTPLQPGTVITIHQD